MSKKSFFFSHDSNARNDDKLVAVRMKHQAEGYGIYFMLIERLLEGTDYMSVKDYNIIAFDLRVSAEKVKSVIEDFGLFQFTECGKLFYSESLNKRMQPLEDIREKRRIAGEKGAEKRWGKQREEPENGKSIASAMDEDSKPIADATQKNGIVKYSKVKNNIPPNPLKGGGAKSGDKKEKTESINKKARDVFEQHFQTTFGAAYYWTAKDAGSMSSLLKKLQFQREQKKMSVGDDEILTSWKKFLESINDGWIFKNFSTTNINSKFNEILTQIKSNHEQAKKQEISTTVGSGIDFR